MSIYLLPTICRDVYLSRIVDRNFPVSPQIPKLSQRSHINSVPPVGHLHRMFESLGGRMFLLCLVSQPHLFANFRYRIQASLLYSNGSSRI